MALILSERPAQVKPASLVALAAHRRDLLTLAAFASAALA
jgi:hypothetical protein